MENASYLFCTQKWYKKYYTHVQTCNYFIQVHEVFEISVYDNIFFQIKFRIIPQHGFFSQRFIVTNLISFLQIIYKALNNKVQVETNIYRFHGGV